MDPIAADDYTASELRCWLEKLGLPKSGTKATLAARLNGVHPAARGDCPVLDPKDMTDIEAGPEERSNTAENQGTDQDDVGATSLEAQNNEEADNNMCVPEISMQLESLKRHLEVVQLENEFLKLEVSRRQPLNRVTAPSTSNLPEIQNNVSTPNQTNVTLSNLGNIVEEAARPNTTIFNNNSLVTTVKEMLPPFDGAVNSKVPVNTWIAQLNAIIKMYKLSEDITRMLVMSKLKDRAQIWLYSSENFLSLPAQDLLTQLAEAFQSKESKIMSRRKFQERKWQPAEDFATYFNDKTLLAAHIRIDDEELIDSIIEGIPDTLLRQQAHMHCFNSSAQLLQAFSKVTLRKPSLAFGRHKDVSGNQPGPAVRCFNCNSMGHFAADCRKPKRAYGACYGCGSLEHLISHCNEKKNATKNEYNA
ncbi:uncharacterized protein LOC119558615 [Drosophila subpulchrella]|uniref:uncharacterized protein LOC119558615 n=3 Tax=Drosophila subpulchrella TaxID=1486046 RepID=UPI0018A18553|nr:uncharacterized protein LOC119558615 [Drosophila subpulchrella]